MIFVVEQARTAQGVLPSEDLTGGAGDDALAAGGPGDDTPDKDVTEDELIERISTLGEEVLDLPETARRAGGSSTSTCTRLSPAARGRRTSGA